jgi:uncharacterized protein (DUF697 family)
VPELRPAVARSLVDRASRRAGMVGAVGIAPVATLVITPLQVRLVNDLASLHGKPLNAQRAAEAAGVVVAAMGWRLLARGAASVVPVPGWLVRGGVAYGATRALGRAADDYFSAPDARGPTKGGMG